MAGTETAAEKTQDSLAPNTTPTAPASEGDSNELLNQILKDEGVTLKKGDHYDPSSSPTIKPEDVDGNVGESTLKFGKSEIKEASGVATSGKELGEVSGSIVDDLFEGLNTFMSHDTGNDETLMNARRKGVEMVMRGELLRSNIDALSQFQKLTVDARNQFVKVPDLLRKEPYMNQVWFRLGVEGDDEKQVKNIKAGEGTVVSVEREDTSGGFELLNDGCIPAHVGKHFGDIFRQAENEYSQVFESLAAGVESIVTEDGVLEGKSPQLGSTVLASHPGFGNWNLTVEDFNAPKGSPLMDNFYKNAKFDTGNSMYINDDSELVGVKDHISQSILPTIADRQSKESADKPSTDEKSSASSTGGSGGGGFAPRAVVGGGSPVMIGGGVPGAAAPTVGGTSAAGDESEDELIDIGEMLKGFEEENAEKEKEDSKDKEREIPEGAKPIYNDDGELVGYTPAEESRSKYGYYDPRTGEYVDEDEEGYFDSKKQRWITVTEQFEDYVSETDAHFAQQVKFHEESYARAKDAGNAEEAEYHRKQAWAVHEERTQFLKDSREEARSLRRK